jgi:hypothetical protein
VLVDLEIRSGWQVVFTFQENKRFNVDVTLNYSSLTLCIFFSLRKNIKASAVCQYSFTDIQRAFEGPYMEVQDSKWREYTGKVPVPRPGSVSL